jgi:hypothetical protein
MCDVNDAKRRERETSPAKKDNRTICKSPQEGELQILRGPCRFNICEMEKVIRYFYYHSQSLKYIFL